MILFLFCSYTCTAHGSLTDLIGEKFIKNYVVDTCTCTCTIIVPSGLNLAHTVHVYVHVPRNSILLNKNFLAILYRYM